MRKPNAWPPKVTTAAGSFHNPWAPTLVEIRARQIAKDMNIPEWLAYRIARAGSIEGS